MKRTDIPCRTSRSSSARSSIYQEDPNSILKYARFDTVIGKETAFQLLDGDRSHIFSTLDKYVQDMPIDTSGRTSRGASVHMLVLYIRDDQENSGHCVNGVYQTANEYLFFVDKQHDLDRRDTHADMEQAKSIIVCYESGLDPQWRIDRNERIEEWMKKPFQVRH